MLKRGQMTVIHAAAGILDMSAHVQPLAPSLPLFCVRLGFVFICRLRDVLFLDLALELCGKGALEQGLSAVRAAAPSTLLGGLLALLQQPVASACLSALPGQGGNAALLAVASQLQQLSQDHAGVWC
jgi:hypothetical protein